MTPLRAKSGKDKDLSMKTTRPETGVRVRFLGAADQEVAPDGKTKWTIADTEHQATVNVSTPAGTVQVCVEKSGRFHVRAWADDVSAPIAEARGQL